MEFATRSIHVGEEPNLTSGGSGDVVLPIHLSTTFARREIEHPTGGYEYSRSGNPTRGGLEQRLASLENAKYGLAFSSGLAAESTVILSLLKSGDHIVAFNDLYGGSRRLFDKIFSNFGVATTYVDARDPLNIEKEIIPQTKMIWLETPTNPLLRLCDIRAIAKIGKERGLITVVDNTFASPYFQNPLDLDADVVVHSATKYLGGHSDVIGGAIMVSNEAYYKRLKFNQNAIGAILSPFDSYLLLRGIKTLALRMEKHAENALKIAQYLETHLKITKVIYPGLKNHPQYVLAKNQMKGFGGMLSFEVKGGLKEVKTLLGSLKVIALAESLGGVESLIEHPALMTHASVPKAARDLIGISENLIRMSVGIEDVRDLLADLEQALSKI